LSADSLSPGTDERVARKSGANVEGTDERAVVEERRFSAAFGVFNQAGL